MARCRSNNIRFLVKACSLGRLLPWEDLFFERLGDLHRQANRRARSDGDALKIAKRPDTCMTGTCITSAGAASAALLFCARVSRARFTRVWDPGGRGTQGRGRRCYCKRFQTTDQHEKTEKTVCRRAGIGCCAGCVDSIVGTGCRRGFGRWYDWKWHGWKFNRRLGRERNRSTATSGNDSVGNKSVDHDITERKSLKPQYCASAKRDTGLARDKSRHKHPLNRDKVVEPTNDCFHVSCRRCHPSGRPVVAARSSTVAIAATKEKQPPIAAAEYRRRSQTRYRRWM
jgi:hypothetical protein